MTPLLLLAAAASAPDLTICPDRPSKANGVCTVPVGHWQLEASAIDWTHNSDSDVWSTGQSFVKLGLTGSSDIEVGWTPYVSVHPPGPDVSGVGDVVVRYKQRLTDVDAKFQAAVIPFVKLPTASHSIGNGKLEGGIAVPLSAPLGPFTVTLGPELDLLADADGHANHLAVTNLLNLSAEIAPKLTISGEIWNQMNGNQHLWSADASAAYLASNRVQLDVSANLGLNRDTPNIELNGGFSVLF